MTYVIRGDNLNLWQYVNPSMDSIFSVEDTIYGLNPSCSLNMDSESALSSISLLVRV